MWKAKEFKTKKCTDTSLLPVASTSAHQAPASPHTPSSAQLLHEQVAGREPSEPGRGEAPAGRLASAARPDGLQPLDHGSVPTQQGVDSPASLTTNSPAPRPRLAGSSSDGRKAWPRAADDGCPSPPGRRSIVPRRISANLGANASTRLLARRRAYSLAGDSSAASAPTVVSTSTGSSERDATAAPSGRVGLGASRFA